jgi:hypothetical protein
VKEFLRNLLKKKKRITTQCLLIYKMRKNRLIQHKVGSVFLQGQEFGNQQAILRELRVRVRI